MEVLIFLSRPDTSNSRVDFSTDGSSRPDRIVTIRRDICIFPGSSTSGSRAYFLFKLHDPTSGESGCQQQLTTRLSSCILDMCGFIHAASGGHTRFQTIKKSMMFENLNDVYIISMLVFAIWIYVVME